MLIAKRVLVIDCQLAGISGDMIIGALLDLGVNTSKFTETMKSACNYLKGCQELEITVNDVTRRGLQAKKLYVKAEEHATHRTGAELRDAIINCADGIGLSKKARGIALNSIDTLIAAEAKIHGESVDEVHLHEAGSVDTVVDIVGTAFALEELGLFKDAKIYSTPVAVGGGLFKFSHGTISSPAPATIEILKSREFPMVGGPISSELATPTGVAILVNITDQTAYYYPPLKPKAIGYGAGSKDFEEMPNVLRVALGEPLRYGLLSDEIYVLETNLDDVTGEVIGYTLDKLLQEGARDVSVIPMSTKKNRPGQILKIIADREDVERLSLILMEETGTLGVRIYPCVRHILARKTVPVEVEIEGMKEHVNVKVSMNSEGRVIQIKPEYDDVKRLADKTGESLRGIMDRVIENAKQTLGQEAKSRGTE